MVTVIQRIPAQTSVPPRKTAPASVVSGRVNGSPRQEAVPAPPALRMGSSAAARTPLGPTTSPAVAAAIPAGIQTSATIPSPRDSAGSSSKILNWIADKANNIPGFRMFTVVLGMNPITMNAIDRSAANILRALVELIPGGAVITQVLDNHGLFNKVGDWIEQQIKALGMVGQVFKNALTAFIDSLGLSDLAPWNWSSVWDRAKLIFTAPIGRLISFAGAVVTDILKMVKEAILKPLAALAQGTRGYDLLRAILGEDPITGEKVPRNAENLIGGFMKLIGQEEIWENAKKGKAVARAWTWFQGALEGLMGFVRTVPRKIMDTISSLTFPDLISGIGAFTKVVGAFVSIAGDFIAWGLKTTWNLLEIIFDVVKPGIMVYIKKTGAALKSIIKNPLPFVGNLVKAAKLGFDNFSKKFGTHLKNGLINWLTGSLEGVYIPTALSLPEMGKFAMSVLGITWGQIRGKIVKVLGPNGEPIMKGLETGFDIVVALVTGGPAAAWELIKEKLTELKDQVVSGIIDFVKDTVIQKAIPKLIAMFIPGAGFISAIISIYDTVMVFVEKISQIIQVVVAFIDSIVAIAAGNISAAANRVEKILAGMLSLAISFLAGFLGLGKITDKIMKVIEKVRAKVDKAIDAAIAWIVDKAKKLYGSAKSAAGKAMEWWKRKTPFKTKSGESHDVYFTGDEKNAVPMVASKDPQPIENKLKHYSEQAIEEGKTDQLDKIKKTKGMLKLKPLNVDAIVKDLQGYFDVFEVKSTPKVTKLVKQEPANYGGSNVAVHMIVDWLNLAYAKSHGSKPKDSALEEVMGRMVTKPKTESSSKFIKGHLLNHNLGGEGDSKNMFPITGKANSQHLHSTESKIKEWVTKNPKKWVWYEVKVDSIVPVFPIKGVKGKKNPNNYINSKFNCMAILKDDTGKKEDMLVSSITSEYQQEKDASVFDLSKES